MRLDEEEPVHVGWMRRYCAVETKGMHMEEWSWRKIVGDWKEQMTRSQLLCRAQGGMSWAKRTCRCGNVAVKILSQFEAVMKSTKCRHVAAV